MLGMACPWRRVYHVNKDALACFSWFGRHCHSEVYTKAVLLPSYRHGGLSSVIIFILESVRRDCIVCSLCVILWPRWLNFLDCSLLSFSPAACLREEVTVDNHNSKTQIWLVQKQRFYNRTLFEKCREYATRSEQWQPMGRQKCSELNHHAR